MIEVKLSNVEQKNFIDDIVLKVEQGEKDIAEGKCSEGLDYFDKLRKHINLSDIPEIKVFSAGHLRS